MIFGTINKLNDSMDKVEKLLKELSDKNFALQYRATTTIRTLEAYVNDVNKYFAKLRYKLFNQKAIEKSAQRWQSICDTYNKTKEDFMNEIESTYSKSSSEMANTVSSFGAVDGIVGNGELVGMGHVAQANTPRNGRTPEIVKRATAYGLAILLALSGTVYGLKKNADNAALREDNTRISTAYTELESNYGVLQNRYNNYVSGQSGLADENEALKAQLAQAQADLAQVQGDLAKAQAELKQAQEDLKNAQNGQAVIELQQKIKEKEAEIKEKEAEISAKQAEINKLKAEVTQAGLNVEEWKQKYEDAKKLCDEKDETIKAKDAEIAKITESYNQAKKELDILQKQLASGSTDKDALLKLIGEKEARITELENELTTAYAQATEDAKTIASLKNENSTLTTENSKLTKELNEVKAKYVNALTDITELKARIQELENAGDGSAEIARLEKELADAEDRADRYYDLYVSYLNKYNSETQTSAALRSQLSEAQRRIEELEEGNVSESEAAESYSYLIYLYRALTGKDPASFEDIKSVVGSAIGAYENGNYNGSGSVPGLGDKEEDNENVSRPDGSVPGL